MAKEAKLARTTHVCAQMMRAWWGRDPVERGIRAASKGRKLARSIHPHLRLRFRPAWSLRVRKNSFFLSLPLIVSPDEVNNYLIPSHVQDVPRPDQSESNAANEGRLDQFKTTASASTKLLLRRVSESADAFGPLKSVAGGLCFILENCEVWPSSRARHPQHLRVSQRTEANKQAIEVLAPRVDALSTSLCAPVSGGDVKEKSRRIQLEW